MNKKTVLMLAATPPDHPKLSLAEEYDQIKDLLERARSRDAFALELRAAAEWDDFPREILDKNPSIVHFSGHGAGAKGVLLRDDSAKSRLATTDELTELFKPEENEIECVLLNACMSLEQATEIVKYVPYVIGMKQEIGDAAAVDFARGFYLAYFAGQSVGASFKWGCAEIRAESLRDDLRRHVGAAKPAAALPEDLKPTLLIRPDVFVACHEEIDIPVQQEFKRVKELEVVGDWLCRNDDRIPGGRTLSFGVARNVLVALTNKWCQEVYAAGKPSRVSHEDPRVRAILWEKCDFPKEFERLSRYDFHDVQKRPDVLQLLIEAFKPRSRSTAPQEAAKGLQAGLELAEEPAVQEAGKGVKKTLVETSNNLKRLDRWKTLHAKMHYVTDGIPILEISLDPLKQTTETWKKNEKDDGCRRAVEQGWNKAKVAFDKTRAGLDALIAYGDRENFAPSELQRDAIQTAAAALEKDFLSRNLRELPEDLLQVQTLFEQHMARIDERLFECAKKVPLQQLVASLNEMLMSTQSFATDAKKAPRIKAFRDGISAIFELQERLETLVLKHNYLQNIADLTKLLHDRTSNAVRISKSMTNVAPLCKRLLAEVQDAWVEEFGRLFSAVNDAIPPALALEDEEPWALRDSVDAMLSHLDMGFFQQDENLKTFCDDLEKLRDGLDNMIEGLRT
jgi:hypothetical protein